MMSKALVAVCLIAALVGYVELAKPFKVEDCGKGVNIANITEFTVSPDPISLSKNITATVDIKLFEDIPPNVVIKTGVYKITSIFGLPLKLRAPCIGGIGSCTTEHCKFLAFFKDQACPFFPDGVTCGCPIKAGSFGGTNITVPVPKLGSLLKFIASGDFQIDMQLYTKERSRERMIACYSFTGTATP